MKAAPTTYGEGPARCGLLLSMGPIPEPAPIEADGIVWPEGWLRHEDGHGYTLLEMEQYLRTTYEEKVS